MINERVQGCIADTLTFDDTSMILFCKESRKASLSQLAGSVNFRFLEKPKNDTMTLFYNRVGGKY